VPDDIALAGFDDILISRYLTPPLSTVQVRIADLGRLALERLAALLDPADKTPTSVETLGCDIVIRESCGAKAREAAAPRKARKPPRPSRL
jgi:LacI family transcriptional regulator